MEAGDREGNFWEHIISLRNHLLWSLSFFIAAVILIFAYASDQIIFLILAPLKGIPLVFLTPLGPFLFKLQISLYAGIIFSLPVWLGAFLHFISPALSAKQKVSAGSFTIASLLLALMAVATTYFYVAPYTLEFLLGIVVPGTSFMLTADSYTSFFLLETMVSMILLQTPLIIVMVAHVGLVSPYDLSRQRRFIYPILLIVLAVLTPTTDALTLLIAFVPAILLTELGFAMAKLVYDNKGE